MPEKAPEMQATLGLTGLTMNAMALIAPGAFLWLTFQIQSATGATGPSMWIGIVVALLLCLATAVCYAELAKLYPGTGSSYYFAEQSFLNHEKAWKYARLSKFIVGWGSHLYYWIYPGVMVGVTGVIIGYLTGTLWPGFMSASNPGPVFMMLVAVLFSFAVAWIANRGVNGSTAVSIAINVIQISALLVFAVMAYSYRTTHPAGTPGWQFDSNSGDAYTYEFQTEKVTANGATTDNIVRDANGVPKPQLDAAGKQVPFMVAYPEKDDKGNFLAHKDAASVVGVHDFAWAFIQATVAILILVGFESVTSMGGEAKNAKRDIPIAVIGSLVIQGAFCYLIRVLCGGLLPQQRLHHAERHQFLGAHRRHDGHHRQCVLRPGWRTHLHAGGSLHCGSGSYRHHAFLRQTPNGPRHLRHAGKDQEVPEHFSLLHSENL